MNIAVSLWQVGDYKAVVPPSLVQGSDIHQKSVFHYSVVGISVLYLIPSLSVSCEAVEPPVAITTLFPYLKVLSHHRSEGLLYIPRVNGSLDLLMSTSPVAADTHV